MIDAFSSLKANVIVMEYPGYSIYPGKPTEELINADALLLYKYLVVEMGVPPGKRFTNPKN